MRHLLPTLLLLAFAGSVHAADEKTFALDFKDKSWTDVITWYQENSNLTRVDQVELKGNVTLKARGKTLAEVTDLLNEAMLTEGYTIIRGEQTVRLWSLDEKPTKDVLPVVTMAELTHRGKSEYVQATLSLGRATWENVVPTVKLLLSQHGTVEAHGNDKIIVSDRVRQVRAVLALIEECQPPEKQLRREYTLPAKPQEGAKTFEVAFEETSWKEVMKWFQEKSGLVLVGRELPSGWLTLKSKAITILEIVDLLNEALAEKNLELSIGEQSCRLLSTAPRQRDAKNTRSVEPKDLPKLSKSQFVFVTIALERCDSQEVQDVAAKHLSENGCLLPFGDKKILVRDRVENLRAVLSVVIEIEEKAKK